MMYDVPNFDFVLAKLKHVDWRIRLLAFLEGEETLSEEEAFSPYCCELGNWIYAEGLKKYTSLQEMQDLEKLHQELHKLAHEVVSLKNNNKQPEAQEKYELMKSTSELLLEVMDSLDIKIKLQKI
ncbi:MAG: CZB domain-containing protein [Thermonemataceae bacterium]|nr:CZB domain-containing protein [Thermonemataceae bacterium]